MMWEQQKEPRVPGRERLGGRPGRRSNDWLEITREQIVNDAIDALRKDLARTMRRSSSAYDKNIKKFLYAWRDSMLVNGTHVSSPSVATWFINHSDRDAGEAITHLKVQKLIYYAEAWFLANFNRTLIDEDLQAWTHGPVSPIVYAKYRDKGWEGLPPEKPKPVPDGVTDFLAEVYAQYGQFSAKRLEALTHEEAPWRVTRGNLPPEAKCTKPIDRLLMRNFYGARIGKKALKALPN